MALIYPTIVPNFIQSLELPDFGVVIYKFDDDSESRRFRYDTGNHTRLLFRYEGRTDNDVANFINFYRSAFGMKEAFTLPDAIIKHPNAWKAGLGVLGTTTLWRFENPPRISTVHTGIYNFNVSLISIFE